MKHVSKTNSVALDWFFDRINLESKIQIKYIDIKNQHTDILTKRKFTRDEKNHLLCFLNINHFSPAVPLLQWRSDLNKIQEKNESQQNQDLW